MSVCLHYVVLGLLLVLPLIGSAAVDERDPFADVPELTASLDADVVKEWATRIDGHVTAGQRQAGVEAAPLLDDHAWFRRLSIDIIGRAPRVAELRAWLARAGAERDDEQVLRLQADDAAWQGAFHYWADQLRIKSRNRFRNDGAPYLAWLKDTLQRNVPYDLWVQELITAEGSAWIEGNGATGFYLRDQGMPEDHMANFMQVFLGTSMACAQCHDHPFDRWTRHEFMALSAFTHDTRGGFIGGRDAAPRELRKRVKNGEVEPNVAKSLRQLSRELYLGVRAGKAGKRSLPKDYQYDDGKPGDRIAAAVPFGEAVAVERGEDPRQALATWLTSTDNPRFTKVIANRIWAKVFGAGLFEPVDQLTDETLISNEPLLNDLEALMHLVRYDLRAFERVLYATDLYRRQAVERQDPGKQWAFPGPVLQRLRAEVIWDSLLVLALPDADQRQGPDVVSARAASYERVRNLNPDQLIAMATTRGELQQQGRALNKQAAELRKQMQGASDDVQRKKLQQQQRQLNRQRAGIRQQVAALMGEPTMMGGDKKQQRRNRQQRGLLRAAELPSPAPPGHFLNRFGQSDRELIANARDEATVPQALDLLNGIVDRALVSPQSDLHKRLRSMTDDNARIDHAFLAVLGRAPEPRERTMAQQAMRGDPVAGTIDVVWALVNCTEYLFKP